MRKDDDELITVNPARKGGRHIMRMLINQVNFSGTNFTSLPTAWKLLWFPPGPTPQPYMLWVFSSGQDACSTGVRVLLVVPVRNRTTGKWNCIPPVGPHGSCYILKLYHLLFLAFRVTDIRTNLLGCLMVWEKLPGVKAVLALDLSCETLLSDLGRLEFFSSRAGIRSIEV